MTSDNSSALWGTAILTVIAVIAAPITALWVQRKGDDHRALKKRREEIFRALWINRARPLYIARVDALNMIEVEFFGERKVLEAWADLFAHFKTDFKALGTSDGEQIRQRVDKYSILLYEMGQVLGYQFGKSHIRDEVYRPELHNEIDVIELQTRRLTRDILTSLSEMEALPVRFVNSESRASVAIPSVLSNEASSSTDVDGTA